jgi:hypothetical protein
MTIAVFVASGSTGRFAEETLALLGLATLLVAFRLSGLTTSRTRLAILAIIAVASAIATVLTDPGDEARALPYAGQAFLFGAIVVALMLAVLQREVVDLQTLSGAIAIYMLIGLTFAWSFLSLDIWNDDQISIASTDTPEFFEFSFVTLTTLGFGNDIPTAPAAGRVVVGAAIIGQIFLATFLARLVSLYGQRPRPNPDEGTS